jgi:cation-transporting P-type ATPase E
MVDGKIADGSGVEVDESLLTGESDPVPKKPGDQVLSGSFVASGSAAYEAIAVGHDSYAARLEAEAATFNLAHSELLAGINRFLKLISWVIVPVAILLAASQLAYAGTGLSDAIAGTVAGVVTMIPEGLVLLTSVAFAVGVIRLGRRQCLVQELRAGAQLRVRPGHAPAEAVVRNRAPGTWPHGGHDRRRCQRRARARAG